MKHFIFSRQDGNWNKRTGSRTLTFCVYQIVKNIPVYIGTTEASSNSYKGDESHVMNFIIEQKKLPAKYEGYYHSNKHPFKITKV